MSGTRTSATGWRSCLCYCWEGLLPGALKDCEALFCQDFAQGFRAFYTRAAALGGDALSQVLKDLWDRVHPPSNSEQLSMLSPDAVLQGSVSTSLA